MNPQLSAIIADAIAILKLKAAESFFREQYGKYLRGETSWAEFQTIVQNYQI